MANGTGQLDSLEETLDRLAAAQERDHEEFTRDHKRLITWQVLMQDKMDKAEAARQQEREDAARNANAWISFGRTPTNDCRPG